VNILAVAIDCHRPEALARFWADALGDGRIERWTDSVGLTYVQVRFAGRPDLLFQPVPEPKAVKNRVHLDLCGADQSSEVARLVSLGAKVLEDPEADPWIVLADPEGNEFCVLPPRDGHGKQTSGSVSDSV
jgi:predicted enzyme related to lactoylglutathione lyase